LPAGDGSGGRGGSDLETTERKAGMRRIVQSTLVSLDGVIAEPREWAAEYFDPDAQAHALEQLRASEAMLMGRRTYEVFARQWPGLSGDYADRLNAMPKYVFSSTLAGADWNNTTIIRGDVVAEVAKLKARDGNDLVVYGHGQFGHTLLEHGLLDQLRLFVHPLFVGHGGLLFKDGERIPLKLVDTATSNKGVVGLIYQPMAR
jgi:dihydrofolate reductase